MEKVDSNGKVRRTNGWEKPYNEEQMASWLLFVLVLLHFYLFIQPLLWDNSSRIVIPIIYGVLTIIAGHSVYKTCSINTCDPNLITNPDDNDKGFQAIDGDGDGDNVNKGKEKHCFKCNVDVDKTSLHCQFCNKCILKYDHHCKW
jgi:palmitoyltransferase ZDHHC1/11